MKQFKTYSQHQTKEVAKKLAKEIISGVIALTGELGTGKTTFVQGFAKGLGVKDKIFSPTFVLIRQHKLPDKSMLYHIDLYRLEGKINIKQSGIKELISNPNNLVLIEWAEKIESSLPKNTTYINIKSLSENKREIIID